MSAILNLITIAVLSIGLAVISAIINKRIHELELRIQTLESK